MPSSPRRAGRPSATVAAAGPAQGTSRAPRSPVPLAARPLAVLAVLATLFFTLLLSTAATPASAAGTITWGASQQVVNHAPFSERGRVNGIACPTAGLCVAVTEYGVVLSAPGTAGPWTPRLTNRQERFQDVSCATATLCLAVTTSGMVYGSSTPAGAWTAIRRVATSLTSVSCPTVTLCATAGKHPLGGGVNVSTDPLDPNAWDGGKWGFNYGTFADVECAVEGPSTLCVAVDGNGGQFHSVAAAPTAGADWLVGTTFAQPASLSCPSATECYGVERSGDLAVMSQNPGVFGKIDRALPADDAPKLACPVSDFCVEVTAAGTARRHLEGTLYANYISTTSHAAGMSAVGCVKGTTACAIGTFDGRIISSGDAAATPTAAWTTGNAIEALNSLVDVDCASASACFAVDDAGQLAASANPTSGAAWTTSQIEPSGRAATSIDCPTTTLCVVGYPGGDIVTVQNPLGARTATLRNVASTYTVTEVACPSAALCILGTSRGSVVTSTAPTTAAWTQDSVGTTPIAGLDCRSATACTLVEEDGEIHISTNPAGAEWNYRGPLLGDLTTKPTALRCPSTTTCLLGTEDGGLGSFDPTVFRAPWGKEIIAGFPADGTRSRITDIDCAVGGVCVAATANGATVTWPPGPNGSVRAGIVATHDTTTSLRGIACAAAGFCLTADVTGRIRSGAINDATITVAKTGEGTGVVTSGDADVTCNATTCSVRVPVGSALVLVAEPTVADSQFGGWTGLAGCTGGRLDCPVTVTGDLDLTAVFDPKQYTVEVSVVDGEGTVTSDPEGIDCGSACGAFAGHGLAVTLIATPQAGWRFAGWIDAPCAGQGDQCQFTVSGPVSVRARFEPGPKTLTVVSQGPGSVTSSPGGIDCRDATCTADVEPGSDVTLTAHPDPGYEVTWGDACIGTATTCRVSMGAAKTATATFVPTPTTPPEPGGTPTPTTPTPPSDPPETPTPTPTPTTPTLPPGDLLGPPSGPGPSGDPIPAGTPEVSAARLSKSSFSAGTRVTFSLTTSHARTARVVISKAASGRRVKRTCRRQTAKNKKAKRCSYAQVVETLTARATKGKVAIPFNGKVGRKTLAPGKYKATITVTGPTGLRSKPKVVSFAIKAPKKKR